jgi:hypothetical protein
VLFGDEGAVERERPAGAEIEQKPPLDRLRANGRHAGGDDGMVVGCEVEWQRLPGARVAIRLRIVQRQRVSLIVHDDDELLE